MKRRRLLSLFVCVILVFSILPVTSVRAMSATEQKPEFSGEKAAYDETDAQTVTITLNLSMDGVPIYGNDADNIPLVNLTLEVPYFDLKNYGYERLYRYPTDDKADYIENSSEIKRPTVLHAMIYLLERFQEGRDVKDCGKGLLEKSEYKRLTYHDIFGNTISKYGASMDIQDHIQATSCYFADFMGFGDNFMYYVNHRFPLMYPGWGATADYILLKDGDVLDIALFTDREFYTRGAFTHFSEKEYTLEQGATDTTDILFTSASHDATKYDYTGKGDGFLWYIMDEDGNQVINGSSNNERITFGKVLEEGEYMLYACEKTAATSSAAFTPAAAKLTIVENQTVKNLAKQMNEIGTVVLSKECKEKMEAVRKAYDSLNEAQRSLVDQAAVQKLEEAEKTYQTLQDAEDKKAASAVEKEIKAIGIVNLTESSKTAIEKARKSYDALTDAQKAKVGAEVLKILADTEKQYETLKQEEEEKRAKAEQEAKDKEAAKDAETKYQQLKQDAENVNQPEQFEQPKQPEQTKATVASVTVTWAKQENATAGYRIYMKGGAYKKFIKVADVVAGKTSYTIKKVNKKNLTAGVQYEVKVVSLKKINSKKVEQSVQKVKAATCTKAPTFSSVKRSKNGKNIALKWKKVSGASGYEIQMSTKQKTGFKTIKTAGAKVKSYTKSKVEKNKVYYFRMRTYKTVAGKKFYSSWSKTVKVKK